MELNISQIDELDGLKLSHQYSEGEISLAGDGKVVGRTVLSLFATREGEDVLLRGTVQAGVQFECDRCLAEIVVPVTQSFDLLYLPAHQTRGPNEEHELTEDDLSVVYYQGHFINLDDLVREQIELMLPMTRVCKADCQGLCQQCGANLNEGTCACQVEQVDPRWAALKELKNN